MSGHHLVHTHYVITDNLLITDDFFFHQTRFRWCTGGTSLTLKELPLDLGSPRQALAFLSELLLLYARLGQTLQPKRPTPWQAPTHPLTQHPPREGRISSPFYAHDPQADRLRSRASNKSFVLVPDTRQSRKGLLGMLLGRARVGCVPWGSPSQLVPGMG